MSRPASKTVAASRSSWPEPDRGCARVPRPSLRRGRSEGTGGIAARLGVWAPVGAGAGGRGPRRRGGRRPRPGGAAAPRNRPPAGGPPPRRPLGFPISASTSAPPRGRSTSRCGRSSIRSTRAPLARVTPGPQPTGTGGGSASSSPASARRTSCGRRSRACSPRPSRRPRSSSSTTARPTTSTRSRPVPGVGYLRQPNGGLAAARNTGLAGPRGSSSSSSTPTTGCCRRRSGPGWGSCGSAGSEDGGRHLEADRRGGGTVRRPRPSSRRRPTPPCSKAASSQPRPRSSTGAVCSRGSAASTRASAPAPTTTLPKTPRASPSGCIGESVAEYRRHGANMTRDPALIMSRGGRPCWNARQPPCATTGVAGGAGGRRRPFPRLPWRTLRVLEGSDPW